MGSDERRKEKMQVKTDSVMMEKQNSSKLRRQHVGDMQSSDLLAKLVGEKSKITSCYSTRSLRSFETISSGT